MQPLETRATIDGPVYEMLIDSGRAKKPART